MVESKLKVFLCHSSNDKPVVRELYCQLSAEIWIQPWLDEEDLLPGQDWDLEIEKAVETSDAVVVCLSNSSINKRGYVQKELRFVLDIAFEMPEETIFIIPLRLEECTPPRSLRDWQYADYFEAQRERAYQRLLGSLRKRADSLGISVEDDPLKKQKAEDDRIAREKANAARKIEQERLAKQKAENERIAHEKAERERLAQAKIESDLKAKEAYNSSQPHLLNDRYQLLEKLDSGGKADVFRARDLMLDRYVAIKVLRKDYSSDPDAQNSFRMEARSNANLSHPNIVTVSDFGFADDIHYIVMEYIPGKNLRQLLRERGSFSVETGIPLIIQACAGLGYAHRAGLVHCDVKPHNMLVSPDGRLKVTNFGLARALATIAPSERTDVVWGSPLYLSPEQAQGEAPSPASDVYSLGVVLYELLSGRPPFTASAPDELMRLHIEAHPVPISQHIPDIPSALEEIIMKVLSKEPAARYRTADQLGRVLLKFGAIVKS